MLFSPHSSQDLEDHYFMVIVSGAVFTADYQHLFVSEQQTQLGPSITYIMKLSLITSRNLECLCSDKLLSGDVMGLWHRDLLKEKKASPTSSPGLAGL